MNPNTDWLQAAGWGVFLCFLDSPASSTEVSDTSAEDWNRRVDGFDVAALALQLEAIGAKYLCITLGQNSGHYCSPNTTYDSIVEIEPSKLSRRDLIADLHSELHRKGIQLMVYLTSGAPDMDAIAVGKLGWKKSPDERLSEFQIKWEAVIRDWSLRWGERVSGWWIDGCYFADAMYRHDAAPNFASFAAALKAGNRNAIVAFCPGPVRGEVDECRNLIAPTEHDDYLAGEVDDLFPICKGRWVSARGAAGAKIQWHALSYLGSWWGQGQPRFLAEFVVSYTKASNAAGGVVTWDVPISDNGTIPQAFLDQLKLLNG